MGLALFATGTMLSIPAASGANFNLFIAAIYILTFGLAFLETTANPYILSMGSEKTATQRLNLAQAFNPIGSLAGMFIVGSVVLSNIEVVDFKNDISGYKQELSAEEIQQVELDVLPFLQAEPRPRKNDITLMEVVASVKEYRKQTQSAFKRIEIRIEELDKGMDSKITSQQMSGHLIGVRAYLKEILVILKK